MNTVVVYDSQFGNTERIAQTIAGTLRVFGQVMEVEPEVRSDTSHFMLTCPSVL